MRLLSDLTGITQRNMYALLNQTRYIALHNVDKIVQGLELQHKVHDGSIRIIPNPTWDNEKWQKFQDERGCRR